VSQEHIALARAQYERWNVEDFDAWVGGFDPDARYLSSVSASLDGRGEFRGHAGIRRFVTAYLDVWEWLRLEPIEFIDASPERFHRRSWDSTGRTCRRRSCSR
jgi:SnoaL-like domain